MPDIHLTESERYVISHLTCAGFTLRKITRGIKRRHTSVSPELERNGPEYNCDESRAPKAIGSTFQRGFF